MKKVCKISALVLGVLFAAAAVLFMLFPGLPAYFKVKHKYSNIDRTVGDFSAVEIPSSFQSFTVKGVSFKAPSDAENSEYGSSIRFGEKGVILITEGDKAENEIMYEELGVNIDPWEYYTYEEADYRHFFEAIGEQFPSSNDASSDILWFYKDRLTAKDCLKLRSRDLDVFLELAEGKEEAWGMENAWKLDIDGCTAYVSQAISDLLAEGLWTVTIYPDNEKSKYYFITISGCSDDTKRQIISSIQLVSLG